MRPGTRKRARTRMKKARVGQEEQKGPNSELRIAINCQSMKTHLYTWSFALEDVIKSYQNAARRTHHSRHRPFPLFLPAGLL
jgi:hypothetical protein